jgi:hypothetical protein
MLPNTDHITRPHCAKCSTRTYLMRRSPMAEGVELRTFECPTCGEIVEQVARAPFEPPSPS